MRHPMSSSLPRRFVAGFTFLIIASTTACATSSTRGVDAARVAAPVSSSDVATEITIDSSTLEVESVEKPGTWVSTSLIYQGSPARMTLMITATGSSELEISVTLPDSTVLGATTTQLSPGTNSVTVALNTDQAAWPSDPSQDHLNVTMESLIAVIPEQAREIPATIAPRPVIFVHGMWQDATWWDSYTKPRGFLATTNPAWKGFAVDTLNTGSALKPLASVNTVQQNADLTWEYISERMRETNAHQVDVVAHSLGGIITRRLLHDPVNGQMAQDAIHTLVLLGVPNGGSPCSDTIPVPANRELTFDALTKFNETNPGYPGVHSVSLYSDHWSTTCFKPESGDSMVPAWSALDQPTSITQEITPGISHPNMTSDPRLYRDYVEPLLQNPPS